MNIGYWRISTSEGKQNNERQIISLKEAGCDERFIFGDEITGSSKYGDRTELTKCLTMLREGDTLVIHELDRLGRSMVEMLVKLIVGVMGYAAEMELKNIKKRTSEGRAVAMNKGVKFGRKRQYTQGQEAQVIDMRTQGNGYGSIANAMGLNVSKVRRILANNGVKQ